MQVRLVQDSRNFCLRLAHTPPHGKRHVYPELHALAGLGIPADFVCAKALNDSVIALTELVNTACLSQLMQPLRNGFVSAVSARS
jgi:hypothetical protein